MHKPLPLLFTLILLILFANCTESNKKHKPSTEERNTQGYVAFDSISVWSRNLFALKTTSQSFENSALELNQKINNTVRKIKDSIQLDKLVQLSKNEEQGIFSPKHRIKK